MSERVLVTGGAGFIGSHLVDALLQAGHYVRVLDNLDPQVHGDLRKRGEKPIYLNPDAEFVQSDIRNQADINLALQDVEVVFHLAAATGVGQSMYQISQYFDVNVQGTANLLESLITSPRKVRKLVLASSRAVYGEGAYQCPSCGQVHPPVRTPSQLDAHQWELPCPGCQNPLTPIPTSESMPPNPGSMYAITKLTQEQMCLAFGQAYGLAATVLRFFNVFGPRQSLLNPYTGIMTVFLNRLLAGQPPEVYEDGLMTRDFIYVSDVVSACQLAMADDSKSGVYNVGSGRATAILELAKLMSEQVAPHLQPQIVNRARVGDIRHCTADLLLAQQGLGFQPKVSLAEGLALLINPASHPSNHTASQKAQHELERLGLLR